MRNFRLARNCQEHKTFEVPFRPFDRRPATSLRLKAEAPRLVLDLRHGALPVLLRADDALFDVLGTELELRLDQGDDPTSLLHQLADLGKDLRKRDEGNV